MALFKIYHGTADDFQSINGFSNYTIHPGYAYFFEDSGELVIDSENGRYNVNAKTLVKEKSSGEVEFIDAEDVLVSGDTGIIKNAILIGGDNNTVRAIAISAGSVVVGDADNGIKGLNGVGALFASTDGMPEFGTLPIAAGGTGATTQAAARANLDVYSKGETGNEIEKVTTLAYSVTLAQKDWIHSGETYTYSYSNTNLTCGKNGNVPPIITWISNQDDYNKIDDAQATVGTGITFTSSKAIEGDIEIVIIDVK